MKGMLKPQHLRVICSRNEEKEGCEKKAICEIKNVRPFEKMSVKYWERTKMQFQCFKRLLGSVVVLFLVLYIMFKSTESPCGN